MTLRNPPPDSGRAIPLVTSDTRNGLLVVFLPIFAVYVITRVLYGYAPGAFRDMQAVGMDISRTAAWEACFCFTSHLETDWELGMDAL